MIYCAAPFNSVRVEATNDHQAVYKPCCLYKQDSQYDTITDYLHSTELKNLQNKFLAQTEFPEACKFCQQQEEQGQVSLRQHFNSKFKQSQKITQLEIFPSNVCNLKCVMCDGKSSTALAAEQKKLNFIDNYREIDNVDVCFESIQTLSELTDVSFIGGEFFLTKKNVEILDLLIQRQIGARVVTNGTIILPVHIDRLKKLSRLELQVSLDGIDENYEFMRYPAKWETVNSNIQYLKQELTNAKINFNFVVQPLNIQYMVPTLDYANRLLIPTRLTNLGDPAWLTWGILTTEEKQAIIDLLDQQQIEYKLTTQQKVQISNYQKTLKTIEFSPSQRKVFVHRMTKILELRQVPAEKVKKHLGKMPDLLD